MIIPITINLKSNSSNEITVAIIATSIPNDAIVFPLCAVLGELRRLIPIINKTAART